MEKVKITQEQANVIEKAFSFGDTGEEVIKRWISGHDFSLAQRELSNMSLDNLIRATYIGYEVEPEFKVGDWVVYEVAGFKNKLKFIGKLVKVKNEDGEEELGVDVSKYEVPQNIPISKLRHATPSEIMEEEERRTEIKLDNLLLDLSNSERIKLYDKLKVIGSSFDE